MQLLPFYPTGSPEQPTEECAQEAGHSASSLMLTQFVSSQGESLWRGGGMQGAGPGGEQLPVWMPCPPGW